MALSSTLLRFDIELADIDRGVYETFDLRVPRHPSEGNTRVVVRMLALCLAHEDGLEFGGGLSLPEEPALWAKGPYGGVALWIDVGVPSAERLHRANKHAERVMIYSQKASDVLGRAWSGQRIHQPETIQVVVLDHALVDGLAERIDRQNRWMVTHHDGALNVSVDSWTATADVTAMTLSEIA
ncbi:MAG: hypothetical protein ACI9MR_000499 [Myxococcota bacterium]|jgi:uncharacterized protein YaeQ